MKKEINKPEELKLEVVYNIDGYYPIMGGDDSNPTWEEYISGLDEKYKPHFELIKSAIIDARNSLFKITGEEKQNRGISFMFSDGNHFGFSWRGWGDLMQAIVNKREGYMTYYM